jgi:hypothetical protein
MNVRLRQVLLPLLAAVAVPVTSHAGDDPYREDTPQYFSVPGFEREMGLLNTMLFRHRVLCAGATQWDQWIWRSVLWQDVEFSEQLQGRLMQDASMPHHIIVTRSYPGVRGMREGAREALLTRDMDSDGYVSTMQHRGLGHPMGWPFPVWGWPFSIHGIPYLSPADVRAHLDGWELEGAAATAFDPARGLELGLSDPGATLTTPILDVPGLAVPFLRIDWWATEGMADAEPYLEWTTVDDPSFGAGRRVRFTPPREDPDCTSAGQTFTAIPLWPLIREDDRITRFRICFGNRVPAGVAIQIVMTAADSRHNVNNAAYIRGCLDYINWTGDIDFVRQVTPRLRKALVFALTEFRVEEFSCVFTPWFGHSGRSGIEYDADGRKTVHPGRGVGDNYWDLLPFGGYDALATAYLHDALLGMAELEETLTQHPDWGIPEPLLGAARLRAVARQLREAAVPRFWNPETRRFAASRDVDGVLHDFGYTFVNQELIYYGLAGPEQTGAILDWLTGKRAVVGDTEIWPGIYHWRFGPRSSTRRNLTYYFSGWSGPESIAWGEQVQDGGAVLGFAYFDLMTRLRHIGPDDAWQRLRHTLDWYAEVREAGSYAAYYSKPGRGRLQGGAYGPGGLGLDCEFLESVLYPQAVIYGFLGFQPRLDGFVLDPRLPADWPELSLSDARFHDSSLTVTAARDRVAVACHNSPGGGFRKRIGLVGTDWSVRHDGRVLEAEVSEGRTYAPLRQGLTEFLRP